MDIPTWLIEILRQFPMVVVIGFAVWWSYNRLERREIRQEELMKDRERRHEEQSELRERRQEELQERLRQDMRRAVDAEIARAEKRLTDAIADKNSEITRLTEQITSELKKLAKEVDQLTKKSRG
jgi:cytoskeletal protein RodZ